MKRLVAIWQSLSPEVQDQILRHWPWMVAAAAGAYFACRMGLFTCTCGQ